MLLSDKPPIGLLVDEKPTPVTLNPSMNIRIQDDELKFALARKSRIPTPLISSHLLLFLATHL